MGRRYCFVAGAAETITKRPISVMYIGDFDDGKRTNPGFSPGVFLSRLSVAQYRDNRVYGL